MSVMKQWHEQKIEQSQCIYQKQIQGNLQDLGIERKL